MASTSPDRVLLDTCVISAFVNEEMAPAEAVAFRGLLARQAGGCLTMLASTVSLEEIQNIPLAYQSSHLHEYSAMVKIVGVSSTASDNRDNPTLMTLLPDENDARLLAQCQKEGVRVFLTLDRKTILNRASQIEAACGVMPQKPSVYFSSTLKSA